MKTIKIKIKIKYILVFILKKETTFYSNDSLVITTYFKLTQTITNINII